MQQLRKKGMETIFISDDGVKDATFIKVAGEFFPVVGPWRAAGRTRRGTEPRQFPVPAG